MATDRWDALLSNSRWYVPAANLLAYRLDADSPQTPLAASDQTLWSLGPAENGRFSGRSVARIVDADGGETQSLTTMEGVVSRSGQARITFSTPVGSTITGIGQVRRVNGQPALEMQMITGGGGAYTSHWAYMLRLNAGTTPPDPAAVDGAQLGYRSSGHRWLLGSRWALAPRGPGADRGASGRFSVSGYRNGYFWGEGAARSGRRPFTVLGSITPEGNLFFNAIGRENFRLRISQGGMLRGDSRQARARLRPYTESSGQLQRPLELRLLDDPLIGGGGSRGGGGSQPAAGPALRLAPLAAGSSEGLDPWQPGWLTQAPLAADPVLGMAASGGEGPGGGWPG